MHLSWNCLRLFGLFVRSVILPDCLYSESGAIFTCGDGSFGQLGHGDYSSQCHPRQVSYFASKPVEQVACGMRHTLVLLRGDHLKPTLLCFVHDENWGNEIYLW